MTTLLGGILGLGGQELIVIAIIGILLFGRRLPEVGRYLGKGIVEFKKGVKGLEDDADVTSYSTGAPPTAAAPPPEAPRPPQRITAAAPKFDELDRRAQG
ncbi:MAG: twin-arginine translocase TatA/TatE family subunit [Gemmataceae bacterium]